MLDESSRPNDIIPRLKELRTITENFRLYGKPLLIAIGLDTKTLARMADVGKYTVSILDQPEYGISMETLFSMIDACVRACQARDDDDMLAAFTKVILHGMSKEGEDDLWKTMLNYGNLKGRGSKRFQEGNAILRKIFIAELSH